MSTSALLKPDPASRAKNTLSRAEHVAGCTAAEAPGPELQKVRLLALQRTGNTDDGLKLTLRQEKANLDELTKCRKGHADEGI